MAITCDYLVIGSGVAGLTFALEAVGPRGRRPRHQAVAQRVEHAVRAGGDRRRPRRRRHRSRRTSRTRSIAGAGLCHERAVEVCVKEGPARIRMLERYGARFDRAPGRGGGRPEPRPAPRGRAPRAPHRPRARHDRARGGARACSRRSQNNPRVRIFEEHTAIDLITLSKYGGPEVCAGAYVLDVAEREGRSPSSRARRSWRRAGAGRSTSTRPTRTSRRGDGVAMAYRAGAEIANMEFYQFHPTCLLQPAGEGVPHLGGAARRGGDPAAARRHAVHEDARPPGELAPRDIVGARHRLRDEAGPGPSTCCSTSPTETPRSCASSFPGIYAECLRFGVDITKEPHPGRPRGALSPAAACPPTSRGARRSRGLWAIGECAHTGLHGANRLASNSLLEGLVFGHRGCGARAKSLDRSKPWPRRCPTGTWGKRGPRRGGRHHAELGRAPPADVELRRHRPVDQAPAARGAAHRAAAGGDRRVLLATTSSRATCSSCATSPASPSSSSSAPCRARRAAACTSPSTTPRPTRRK